MSLSELPSWISLVGRCTILVGVLLIVLRCRETQPQAAKLFVSAIGINGVTLFAYFVQLIAFYRGGGIFNPVTAPWMILTAILTVIQIASWSLIAWAVLMRPDEVARSEAPPC